MWQKLTQDLADQNFTVIAIAMDVPDAARPWIEAAKPTYPCLIDREHRVADLYDMVNVPQAVWIDESGRIVRPPENAGAMDSLRYRDKTTRQLPEDKLAERDRIKAAYVEAVRDWAIKGSASAHVLDAATIRARSRLPDDNVAMAHAHFRLAQHLVRGGNTDEAKVHFAQASRLHPGSWNIWRQGAAKDATRSRRHARILGTRRQPRRPAVLSAHRHEGHDAGRMIARFARNGATIAARRCAS